MVTRMKSANVVRISSESVHVHSAHWTKLESTYPAIFPSSKPETVLESDKRYRKSEIGIQ